MAQDSVGASGLVAEAAELAAAQPTHSLEVLNRALEQYRQADDLKGFVDAAKKTAVALDMAGNLPMARQVYALATVENLPRPPKNQEEWVSLGWLYANGGYTLFWYGLYYESRTWYEQARSIFEEKTGQVTPLVVAYVHRELGNLYTRFGDHPAALILLERARSVAVEHGDFQLAAEAANDIAIAQADRGLDSAATATALSALAYPALSPVSICLLRGTMAMLSERSGQPKEARRQAMKGLVACKTVVRQRLHDSGPIWLSNTHKQLGEWAGEAPEAMAHFSQALELLRQHYPDTSRREFAKIYLLIAEQHLQGQRPVQALQAQQAALQAVLYRFRNDDPATNPDPATFYPENTIAEALQGKARSWYMRYRQSADLDHLRRALDCYALIFEAERVYRQVHHFEASSLAVVAESNRRTETALDVCWEYFQKTADTQVLERAFEFAEKSRSVLLFEALRHSGASSIANIPDSLLLLERELNTRLAAIDKSIFFVKQAPQPANARTDSLEQLSFELRHTLQDLHERINRQYPAFHQIKYQQHVTDVAAAQAVLQPGQTLLEYFVGERVIYVFVINRNAGLRLFRLEKDFPLEAWVEALRSSIEQFQFPTADKQTLCETYTHLAARLYDKIWAPVEAGLSQDVIVVAGGYLGLLPFSALLSEAPVSPCRFRAYPYLLRRYSISYVYSAALLRELLAPGNPPGGRVLAVAPTFSGQGGFGALSFNLKSAGQIARLTDGQVLLGEEATIGHFLQLAPQQRILYLATHAQANTAEGAYSFIALAGNGGGYDSLFARDLYTLRLPAELIFLGACETGRGNWQQGEGIISLARAFLYAGSRSIVTTLWSINDESNSHITSDFFQLLMGGHSKDAALRQAQLNHIETAPHDLFAHPVYWAAYSLIGNAHPLENRRGGRWYLWLVAGVMSVAAGWAFRKRNCTKRTV